jgi:hypothetical protein
MHARTLRLALGFVLGAAALHGQADATSAPRKPPPPEERISVDVPDEVTVVEEASLVFRASSVGHLHDPGGDRADGIRFYTFKLKPKEKLSVKMEAEDANRIGMYPAAPDKPDGMFPQFTRLQRQPKTLLSSRFDITNVTGETYPLTVVVYGHCNYHYRLHLTRTMP